MRSNLLFHREGGIFKRILVDNIYFLEANENYVYIQTNVTEKIMIRMPFSKMLNLLPASNFAQIHRGLAVAVDKIEEIGKTRVTFLNVENFTLPVSPTYRKELLKKITILDQNIDKE